MVTLTEVRNAARSLTRSPTVTLCAVGCLALGIGATTALSSAISAALLRPLPFKDPERLVAVWRTTPQSGPTGGWSQSPANYADLSRQSTQIQGLTAGAWGTAVVNLPDNPVQASQRLMTGNLFETLGTRAQLGRLITPEDDRLDAPPVAVITDEFFRSTFGGDRTVIGRVVPIDGTPTTIIGVLPHDFRVPLGRFVIKADLWMPIKFTPEQLAQRRGNYLLTFGRLAPGATVESAQSELRGIFANMVRENANLSGDNVRVAPLQADSVASIRTPLILLFAAVCMVLLIAATNVAALLLARGVQRQREMAVRTALGAGRWDTLRPVLLESLILSTVSVVLGIGLASLGVKTIGLLAAARIPQLAGLGLDMRVLAFALVLSVLVALVCGAAPAIRSTRVDPQDALRGGRGGGTGRKHHRALRSLVIVEIALSLVLLIGAGLVLKGFARLLTSDPGFDPRTMITVRVTTAPQRYPERNTSKHFVPPMLEAIRRVPGVEAAATISAVPYITWGNNSGIRYEGEPPGESTRWPIVEQREVSDGWFDVTKQKLVSGRLFQSSDLPNSPWVVVVNEALKRRDFKGKDPVGKRFHLSDTTFGTIVGVVSDIKNMGPISDPVPEMYLYQPQSEFGGGAFSLMIRARQGDPMNVLQGVRTAVRSVDPTAAIAEAQRMTDVIAGSLGGPRFYFSLLGSFAAIAILLAVAGLYGVLSYAVAQRTREIGIRSALGSSRSAIIRLVALEGFRLVAIGVVLGLAAGAATTRLMVFMLYGVSPLDTSAWMLAVLLMVGGAMLAALIPARRAARVNPLVAIQTD